MSEKSHRRWFDLWRFRFIYDRYRWANIWFCFNFVVGPRQLLIELIVGNRTFMVNYFNPKGASDA